MQKYNTFLEYLNEVEKGSGAVLSDAFSHLNLNYTNQYDSNKKIIKINNIPTKMLKLYDPLLVNDGYSKQDAYDKIDELVSYFKSEGGIVNETSTLLTGNNVIEFKSFTLNTEFHVNDNVVYLIINIS